VLKREKIYNMEEKITNNKYRAYINFMLRRQQWDGIEEKDIEAWIRNFGAFSSDDLQNVYKLLTNIIYYSLHDMVDILEEGVRNSLFYDLLLKTQKESGFTTNSTTLLNIYKEEVKKTCFIPLLDNDSPYESGNYIARLLVQHEIISQDQSFFLNAINDKINNKGYSRIVVCDDCLGSGDQFESFWKTKILNDSGGNQIKFCDFCKKRSLEVIYFVLFGYEDNIEKLRNMYPDIRIHCLRKLTNIHRVFSSNSYVWPNINERDNAIFLFSSITNDNNIPLYGHKGLDFALIMHNTIPDWSLPIFWMSKENWNPLIRRKNSNYGSI
jgi:hypothetical protein